MSTELNIEHEFSHLKKLAKDLRVAVRENGKQKANCLLKTIAFASRVEKEGRTQEVTESLLAIVAKRNHAKQTLVALIIKAFFKRSPSVASRWNAVADDLRAKCKTAKERRRALKRAGGVSAYFNKMKASKTPASPGPRFDLKQVKDAVEHLDVGKRVLVVSIDKFESRATATTANVVTLQNLPSILNQILRFNNVEWQADLLRAQQIRQTTA